MNNASLAMCILLVFVLFFVRFVGVDGGVSILLFWGFFFCVFCLFLFIRGFLVSLLLLLLLLFGFCFCFFFGEGGGGRRGGVEVSSVGEKKTTPFSLDIPLIFSNIGKHVL